MSKSIHFLRMDFTCDNVNKGPNYLCATKSYSGDSKLSQEIRNARLKTKICASDKHETYSAKKNCLGKAESVMNKTNSMNLKIFEEMNISFIPACVLKQYFQIERDGTIPISCVKTSRQEEINPTSNNKTRRTQYQLKSQCISSMTIKGNENLSCNETINVTKSSSKK